MAETPIVATPDAPVHPNTLPVGGRLGEFEVQSVLGVGGFGIVYRCFDHSLQRAVAVKEYAPSSLVQRNSAHAVVVQDAANEALYQSGLQSFIGEARLLAQFDHPSLVKVFRFWEANNTAYMAMQLYKGITLKQARQQFSVPPSEEWLRSVTWCVLDAVRVLHQHQIWHRDISPDNIFLQDIGPPVLLDLGAARVALQDREHGGGAVLKLNYAPIEQFPSGKTLVEGPWTDLYALAAVLYGCVRNEPPLPATLRAVRDRMPSFSHVARTVKTHFGISYSKAFIRAVAHALVLSPARRTQSIAEFVGEMHLDPPQWIDRLDWRVLWSPSMAIDTTPLVEVGDTSDAATLFLPEEGAVPIGTQHEAAAAYSAEAPEVAPPPAVNTRLEDIAPASVKKSQSRSKGQRVAFGLVLGGCIALATSVVWQYKIGQVRQVEPVEEIVEVGPVVAPDVAASRPVSLPQAVEPLPVTAVAEDEMVLVAAQRMPAASASEPQAAGKSAPTARLKLEQKKLAANRTAAPASEAGASTTPVLTVEPPPVPSASETPAHVAGPEQQCANSSFFTRPMCIYLACKEDRYTHLPVCVEDRKRWEERDRKLR